MVQPSNPDQIRAQMIACGVLRPEGTTTPRCRACGVPLDGAGINRAAVSIFANTAAAQLPGVIAQADPRVAERLRYLAARHCVQFEAA
jgi:hypothetical protein